MDTLPALRPGIAPPEHIDLNGLVLRRWQPEDRMARFTAVAESFDHLHPWMDWCAEPITLEQQHKFNDLAETEWPSRDGNCNYGIFDDDGTMLGAIGLHDRIGPDTLEIGYWCHVAHTGRGIITRAAAALTDLALALPGINHLEIHCDEANVRSAAVPRRLGYRLDRIEPRQPTAPAEIGQGMFWIKDRPH